MKLAEGFEGEKCVVCGDQNMVVIGQDDPGVDRSTEGGQRIDEGIGECGKTLGSGTNDRGVCVAGGGHKIGCLAAVPVRRTVQWALVELALPERFTALGGCHRSPAIHGSRNERRRWSQGFSLSVRTSCISPNTHKGLRGLLRVFLTIPSPGLPQFTDRLKALLQP